jgi:mRNA interferase MazF
MPKDFRIWNKRKSEIQLDQPRLFFHEREIWFCSLGVNIGYEQDGSGENFLRPTLVFKKFNNEVFWAIPLTRSTKRGKFYFTFTFTDGVQSAAILSQLRLVDAKRLRYKVGDISQPDFTELTKKFKELLP